MAAITFERFVLLQRRSLRHKRQLQTLLKSYQDWRPSPMDDGERLAFARVFDAASIEIERLSRLIVSPRELRQGYVAYLSDSADSLVQAFHERYAEGFDDDYGVEKGEWEASIREIYNEIEKQQPEVLKISRNAESAAALLFQENPFLEFEEEPPWRPREPHELDAADAAIKHPWLLLESEDEARRFFDSEAAEFLMDPNAWDEEDVRVAKQNERILFLGWLRGCAERKPPKAVVAAWRSRRGAPDDEG